MNNHLKSTLLIPLKEDESKTAGMVKGLENTIHHLRRKTSQSFNYDTVVLAHRSTRGTEDGVITYRIANVLQFLFTFVSIITVLDFILDHAFLDRFYFIC